MAAKRRPGTGVRVLRAVLVTILAIAVIVAVAVVALVVTNPAPEAEPPWQRAADLPEQRGEVASAVAGGELFIIGGLAGVGRTSQAVHAYDPDEDGWRQAPDLPEARHHAAAAELDGTIYVTGGAESITDWTPRAEVWTLEPGAQRWESVAPMPEGRQGHAMVALDDRLHVVGGEGPTTEVLTFTPGEGWERGAPLGDNRDHLRAVARDGEVWALGGRTSGLLDWVDVYEPDTGTWRAGPSLPEPMSAMAVGTLGDAIHVVDGEDPSLVTGGIIDRHLVLPPDEEEWEEALDSVLAVHGAGYGVIDDELIIAGGASRQGALSLLSWTEVTQRYAPE
ncbi:kelch repeat-containing protein [Haloechinothrix sp. LS1_15]|uniref:Kelch repeat-containing protein n=1 Tax=Haloechinothrix sp. LS1_15 TaxID=2652248 RepID=UPI00294B3770|nr:kelch repeat-containing protein [Haloechinothrix sp. LS1_15]